MTIEPWVYVAENRPDVESGLRFSLKPTGLSCVIEAGVSDECCFYLAIEEAVPLISGFGRNKDALIDLLRTFGWGPHAGKSHCIIWRVPHEMMQVDPAAFDEITDIMVAVSKELLTGEDLDATFDPLDERDWVSTRLDLVFLVQTRGRAIDLARKLSTLSNDWADEFHSLDVPVDLRWDL